MKNIFAIILFTLASFMVSAQVQFVQILQDTATKKFRFQRIEIREYENFSDTLIVDKFPERWLDSTELKAYQLQVIDMRNQRLVQLRQSFQAEKQETDFFIATVDAIFGPATYQSYEKAKIENAMQGNWKLQERSKGEPDEITITGKTIKMKNKTGSFVVTDAGEVIVSGLFAFDLTFNFQKNNTLKAVRGNGQNERVFILKR